MQRRYNVKSALWCQRPSFLACSPSARPSFAAVSRRRRAHPSLMCCATANSLGAAESAMVPHATASIATHIELTLCDEEQTSAARGPPTLRGTISLPNCSCCLSSWRAAGPARSRRARCPRFGQPVSQWRTVSRWNAPYRTQHACEHLRVEPHRAWCTELMSCQSVLRVEVRWSYTDKSGVSQFFFEILSRYRA